MALLISGCAGNDSCSKHEFDAWVNNFDKELQKSPPKYPFLARNEHRSGEVKLLVTINKNGHSSEVKESSGHKDLDIYANNAINNLKIMGLGCAKNNIFMVVPIRYSLDSKKYLKNKKSSAL